jgi:hypothetical protein
MRNSSDAVFKIKRGGISGIYPQDLLSNNRLLLGSVLGTAPVTEGHEGNDKNRENRPYVSLKHPAFSNDTQTRFSWTRINAVKLRLDFRFGSGTVLAVDFAADRNATGIGKDYYESPTEPSNSLGIHYSQSSDL